MEAPVSKLLLISNSYQYGLGYLDHCADEITEFLSGVKRVLFIPYGLGDHTRYFLKARDRFRLIGYEMESIHQSSEPRLAAANASAFFVGGGNTFRLLKALYGLGLTEIIRDRVSRGVAYVGSSAGAIVACPTIKTTNDMPIVFPPSFNALNLIRFQINPHYLDSDPNSTHMGETRETRIREFHEENNLPVIGLREGSFLRIEGKRVCLKGKTGARLFLKGEEVKELPSGSHLHFLLDQLTEDNDWVVTRYA